MPSTQNVAVKKIKQDFNYHGIYIAGNNQTDSGKCCEDSKSRQCDKSG